MANLDQIFSVEVHRAEKPQDVAVRQASTAPLVFFMVLVAILVSLFKFPPLLDYANHYARMWLLAGGIKEAPFPEIYTIEWNRTFTNVGIDLLARFIGPVIGVALLARALLFLAIVLPPSGAIVLHRRLFGGSHYWQIGMLYLAWCATLIGGFINFQIGLGLALLFATVDHRLLPGSAARLFLWRVAVSLLLTLVHLFSAGFFLAIICGLEFSWRFDVLNSRQAMLRLIGKLAAAIIACLLSPAALALTAADLPGSQAGDIMATWNDSPILLISNLLSAIWTYVAFVDAIFLVPILLVCSRALTGKSLRVHAGLVVTAAGLLALSILSPLHAFGTGWISWRFPIMAALVGMVMICPFQKIGRRRAVILFLVLNVAVFGRTLWIGYNWWRGQADVASVEKVLEAVPSGAAILPLQHESAPGDIKPDQRHYAFSQDTFRHLPTLAVPLAHAFVPTLFSAQGKQPLAVRPSWSDRSVPEGNLFSTGVLSCPGLMAEAASFTPYLVDWRSKFDFILVVNADAVDQNVGDVMPAGIRLLKDAGFARLYGIDRNATPILDAVPASCPDSFHW
ncbi:hypothetical protein FHT82_001748 [Rhizobium sp. BK275]|uniref:hypothetical protein n=1 Tax=Rhizobium sp. BK275 TaxID=2587077 RepID=UPI001617CA44|nr:hypothetical protein [Rhizobium sp. BK275]MBB3389025.1 hypothetical protein [Rhizobium sp. BK275]